MHITIQHFNGCPNWLEAAKNVEEAIESAGISADVSLELITTPEQAEAASFHGSPSILLDGTDPFADPDARVGLTCRVFDTPDGKAGSPTVEQIIAALEAPGKRGAA